MKKSLVTLLLAALSTHAQAQQGADFELCRTTRNNPDLAIKHCSAAIDSRKFTGDDLARLHHSRGVEWAAKGDTERAISDFDNALKFKPGVALTHHARGIEFTSKGDYARALADFDAAQKIDPKINIGFDRGRTLFYMGNFSAAETTIETALKERPNVYTAIWLYLARKHGGVFDAEEQLERDTRRLRAGWPAPLIAFYLGRTDAQSIVNSATDSDAVRKREIVCEAHFYMAHGWLIKGDKPRAKELLETFSKTCPKNLLESEGVLAELRRMK